MWITDRDVVVTYFNTWRDSQVEGLSGAAEGATAGEFIKRIGGISKVEVLLLQRDFTKQARVGACANTKVHGAGLLLFDIDQDIASALVIGIRRLWRYARLAEQAGAVESLLSVLNFTAVHRATGLETNESAYHFVTRDVVSLNLYQASGIGTAFANIEQEVNLGLLANAHPAVTHSGIDVAHHLVRLHDGRLGLIDQVALKWIAALDDGQIANLFPRHNLGRIAAFALNDDVSQPVLASFCDYKDDLCFALIRAQFNASINTDVHMPAVFVVTVNGGNIFHQEVFFKFALAEQKDPRLGLDLCLKLF